jgi:hypothetical protein
MKRYMSEVSNGTNRAARVEDYGNILEALRTLSASAHIAGGAVRDTLLGVQIRDIDIFLADAHGDRAAALLRSTFSYVKVGEWRQYEGFSDPAVLRVAKFEKADETIPICLIGLAKELSPYENIERFDYGICMAFWWGGTTEMFTADQFKSDAETKTFTLYRADNAPQFAYSMVRFQKLTTDRYKGWTLSVPNQFEELAKEHSFRQHWYRDGAHFGYRDWAHFGLEHASRQILKPKER